jgi:predicted hydrocarbon binding protein
MKKNSVLDELFYDPSCGALTYKAVRYMLIRPETIIGFQKTVEETNRKTAGDALFQGGFQGGYLSAKKYKEIHNFNDNQIIEFMMEMGTEIGWGHFQLDYFNTARQLLRITVKKSPFAVAYGESSAGVCHLIRGVVSGLATALFGKDCIASEIECLAKGDAHCVFSIMEAI